MNDFFQSLSFHGAPKPAAVPGPASVALRCIMRSFDEIPFTAYRPAPRPPGRGNPKSRIKNRK